MNREHELALLDRCIEIMAEIAAELREYNREVRELRQRRERDALHAQWREDNQSLGDTPSSPRCGIKGEIGAIAGVQ